jgi:pSer/pThr/pTyr-binding forkhead associated (FHA) protein
MAYLSNHQTQNRCYLYAHHSFGRFAYSVDTLLTNPCVSKMHAVVEWKNDIWVIRDLSSNGTWLNQNQLTKEEPLPLKIGDIIRFSDKEQLSFQVEDLSPPSDMLLPITHSNANQHDAARAAITLQHYHLLPNDQSPEIALISNQLTGQWYIEYVNEPHLEPRLLQENDVIEYNNQHWKLQLSHLEDSTELNTAPQLEIEDLLCIFELSLNEEITKLKVKSPQKITNLHTRSHHYLMLSLARYRVEDAEKGLPSTEQGWVHTDRLLRDLGVDMAHLNIQIHRSRKQFADMLTNVHNADNVIERQLRQVRFACPAFEIYKGHQLESSLTQANS